jgi:hypothetical protein
MLCHALLLLYTLQNKNEVKKAVLKTGLYVVEQTGDTMKINVPEGFKPKEW